MYNYIYFHSLTAAAAGCEVFCSADLGPCSTAAGCLQSLKLPLRPTPVTCVRNIISSTDTADTQRPDAARLENNLLDWYHITSRRLLIDCKNCAKFPANLSFIDYQPTHAAITRLGYYWHCQEPGAGGAWWRGLMRSLLTHHSALNLFCLARSWGK